jgi:5-methylcytosine-specific restriction protein A
MCAEDGKKIKATVVDHVIPHKGDYQLFWSRSNWQALCTYHHNKKTVEKDGGLGNAIQG